MARNVKAGIKIEVDAKQGTQALDSFSKRFKDAFSGVGLATAAATKGLDLVQGALGGVASAFKETIALANEQERLQRKLTAALSLTGDATDENIAQIEAFNTAMQQRLGIGDESLLQVEANLLALGIEKSRLQEATKATIGLAQVTGDLNSASRLVGRALQGETSALTRYGIKADSVAEVQDKLNDLFTLAEAQSGSYATQTARLDANLGDLGEAIGELVTKNPQAIDQTSRLADATKGLELAIRDTRSELSLFLQLTDEFNREQFGDTIVDANDGLLEFGQVVIGAVTGLGAMNQTIDVFGARSKEATASAKELSQELADISVLQSKGGFFPTEAEIEEGVKSTKAGLEKIATERKKAAEKNLSENIKAEDEIAAASAAASAEILAMEKARADEINAQLEADTQFRIELAQSVAAAQAEVDMAEFIRQKEQREEALVARFEVEDQFREAEEKNMESAEKDWASFGSNVQSSVASGFAGAILSGENFGDAMEKLALRIASSFLEKGIFSLLGTIFTGGLGGGLLGGLLGGLFAEGGRVGPMGQPVRAQSGRRITGGTPGVDSVPVLAQQDEAFLSVSTTKALMRELGMSGGGGFAGGGVVAGGGGGQTVIVQSLVFPTRSQFQRATRDEQGPNNRRARRRGIKT